MIERFQQVLKKTPVLAPADIASTDTNTAVVDLVNAQHCTFLVNTGSITSSSTTAPIITLMAATSAATTSATAIAFKYRKSSIIATDTWADIADATATGMTLALNDDSKLIEIDVDPALVAAKTDGRFVYLHIDTSATTTALVIGASVEIEPRYAANTMQSCS